MTLEKFIEEIKGIIDDKEVMIDITVDNYPIMCRVNTKIIDIIVSPKAVNILPRATIVSFPPTAEITKTNDGYTITFSNIVINIEVF